LNASGSQLDAVNQGLYINPVRLDQTFNGGYIGYNSTTREVLYNTGTATFADVALTNTTIAGTAGSATGTYLRIVLNGTPYKLALLADV
jgi:hypothetical protein